MAHLLIILGIIALAQHLYYSIKRNRVDAITREARIRQQIEEFKQAQRWIDRDTQAYEVIKYPTITPEAPK